MKKSVKRSSKLLALLLAIAIGVTFTPVFDNVAYAAEDEQAAIGNTEGTIAEAAEATSDGDISDEDILEEGEDIEVELAEPIQDENVIDITEPETPAEEGDVSVDIESPEGTADESDVIESQQAIKDLAGATEEDSDELSPLVSSDAKNADISDAKSVYTMDVTRNGATVTIKATVKSPYSSDLKFRNLVVDNSVVQTFNSSSISASINMNNYSVGYHTIYLQAYSTSLSSYYNTASTSQRTDITTAPNYRGVIEVYSNYLVFAPYNMYGGNAAYDLYMEYSPNGGKTWQRSGYMRRNSITLYTQQQYSIGGLAPNTNYAIRIFYGTYVNGTFFRGPALNLGVFKTGKAKRPKFKSVTAKAVKVKYHKVKHYGYYTGVYLYTEKFYTYKVKVIVKLKKKPGTAGIWINGKFCKGNKKKYTATFSPYPNYSSKKPKGRVKFTVSIASYQNKSYGGYSPLYQKTKKLK